MMYRIALIKKYSERSPFWNNLEKRKVDNSISTDEMVQKYEGFEGELVRLSDQEPDLNRMENLLSEGHGISLLYIFSGLGESEKHELQNFSFMGFDYGICESDSTLFSSIFNEVLFGVNDELRKVYEHLNSNLLFPNIDFAKKYVDIQRQLFKKEHDVESPSEMKVYDIWKRNIL